MPLLQQIHCSDSNTCFSIRLEKRKVIKKTIAGIIGMIIPLLFIGFFLSIFSATISTGGTTTVDVNGVPTEVSSQLLYFIAHVIAYLVNLFLIIVILGVYIFQCFYYRYYFYDLRGDEIVIKKGVISRNEITLPYSKIQQS